MTRPRISRAERCRSILAAAQLVFSTHGYAGSTLEQIAEAAEVSSKILSKHFATKPELLNGLAIAFTDSLFTEEAASTDAGEADSLLRLQDLTSRFLIALRREAPLFRIFTEVWFSRDPEARPILEGFLNRSADGVARLLAAGQAEGVVRRSLDPQHAAWDWLRFFLGYAILRPVTPGPPPEMEPISYLLDTLLHGSVKFDI